MSLFRILKRPFCLRVDVGPDTDEDEDSSGRCPETCPVRLWNNSGCDGTSSCSFIDENTPEVELGPAGSLPTLKKPGEYLPKRPVPFAKKSPSSSPTRTKVQLRPPATLTKLLNAMKKPPKVLPNRPVVESRLESTVPSDDEEAPGDNSSDYSFIDEDTSEVELGPVGSLPKFQNPKKYPKQLVASDEPNLRKSSKKKLKASAIGQEGESGLEEYEEDTSVSDAKEPPEKRGNFQGSTVYFKDGVRRIDMVLVYLDSDDKHERDMRAMYEALLRRDGLELELEPSSESKDKKSNFLKIHIPWPLLRIYAESFKLKLPLKLNGELGVLTTPIQLHTVFAFLNAPLDYSHSKIPDKGRFYMGSYTRKHENQFVINDHDSVFSAAQRSQIVWYIMRKIKLDSTKLDIKKIDPVPTANEEGVKSVEVDFNTNLYGVRLMINAMIYDSAYPVHDGRYEQDDVDGTPSKRRILYLEWARFSNWYKRQPIGMVRGYFGRKIGLYFAWLGFYTGMLIIPSVLGIWCILYGVLTMYEDQTCIDTCSNTVGNITLCPICNKVCNYVQLNTYCIQAQLTYVFGNTATVFYATFMSFWSTLYLELWKRRQAMLTWELDLQDSEEIEEPRPEFEQSTKTFRHNPITKEWEPYQPTFKRWMNYTTTCGIVLFMLAVVLATVLSSIVYRLSMVAVIYNSGNKHLQEYTKLFVALTGAMINLTAMVLLTRFYDWLAEMMMRIENPCTQSEYEHSFTFKIFVFQFINHYSSLIYIAMFKGRFFLNPGDSEGLKNPILVLRTDVCAPTGCLSELTLQMFVIMVGKQFMNNFMEFLLPKIQTWLRKRKRKITSVDLKREYLSWEEDYEHLPLKDLFLLEEYLEMIIQYGFITLFIASFPLAPLFAWFNNIIEIRLDAYKMVTQMRRPVAQRVKDIGAWYSIMQALTFAAVVSNAFVIAYTSNFIPQMVYRIAISPTNDLTGFVEWMFSDFKTSDYSEHMGPGKNKSAHTFCKYRAFRRGYDYDPPYALSEMFWHVSAARFIFVVIFVLLVFSVPGVMAYIIDDVPEIVQTNMKREKLIVAQAQLYAEAKDPDAKLNYKTRLDRLLE